MPGKPETGGVYSNAIRRPRRQEVPSGRLLPMSLTRIERQYLTTLLRIHEHNGAAWSVQLPRILRSLAFIAGFMIAIWAGCAFLADDPLPPLAGYCAGAFVGMTIVTLSALSRSSKLWPVASEIMNWARVAELLEADQDPKRDDF